MISAFAIPSVIAAPGPPAAIAPAAKSNFSQKVFAEQNILGRLQLSFGPGFLERLRASCTLDFAESIRAFLTSGLSVERHLLQDFFRGFPPTLHFEGDRFGVQRRIGQRVAEIFFLGIDGDALKLIAVAQAQGFEQPVDIRVLLIARRDSARATRDFCRATPFHSSLWSLCHALGRLFDSGVNKRCQIEVK